LVTASSLLPLFYQEITSWYMTYSILCIEGEVAWATPVTWTEIYVACFEGGCYSVKVSTV